MNNKRTIKFSWLPGLALLCCLPGQAATVYRTVDADGVVSFSDTRPADDTPVDTLVVDGRAPQVSEAEQQRLKDMRDTTDRMAADRMAREKHRAEIRQLQAQSQPQYPAQYPNYYDPGYIGSVSGYSRYNRYPARRPWRSGHRPRPEHPIARPPLRPPLHRPGRNSESHVRTSLPGNNYPASQIRKYYPPNVRAAFEK
jgi:hypothetical protein